ncbi:MAG: DUF433 domain-containing protein [Nitrososphaeria archaeon]|nr:DUF433 domain-containing protein [Nitrososphaeria archaeon]
MLDGKPIIKGSGVPVEAVVKRVAEGLSVKEVLEDYPNLGEEDVKAALKYAASVIVDEKIIPVTE